MLEAKAGHSPKSEKAAAFWRVGGAGRGVQPFLRKETNESNLKNGDFIAESQNLPAFRHCEGAKRAWQSILDSANQTKFAESRPKSQNLRKFVKKSA
ncbi:hypothetical protein [Helicobacter sp. 23-1045]